MVKDRIIKSYYKFNREINFNIIPEMTINFNLTSKQVGTVVNDQVMKGVYQIQQIHQHPMFSEFMDKLENNFNKDNLKADLDIFCSFSPGIGGNVHRDTYDVCLLNIHGEVCYRVNDEIIYLKNGDLLRIFAGEPHQSIGITPRITLSYGYGF